MSSIVLSRGTLPVDVNLTSSVLMVLGGPSLLFGVFGGEGVLLFDDGRFTGSAFGVGDGAADCTALINQVSQHNFVPS